mgnify:CR=1 FL=1
MKINYENYLPFYSRPTIIENSKEAIKENIANIYNFLNKTNKKVKICAIIKSNAYGHGLLHFGSILNKIKYVSMLGVTSIEEAILLREKGVTKPILLLGSIYPFENFKYLIEYKITPTIASSLILKELEKFCKKQNCRINFHVKIDTGMGRIGILPENVESFINEYKSCKNVMCEGLYTHFSSAAEDKEYTFYQLGLFKDVYKKFLLSGIKPKYVHAANSAALLLYPQTYFNMVRPGLIIYGLLPFKDAKRIIDIKRVLTLKSKIVFLKTLPKGKYISYSKTYCTTHRTKVATVPIGYADGILRKLSNVGKVLVKGCFCNIIGRVTMDMIMVDVTGVKDVKVGDEVVLIGQQGNNTISAEDLALWSETINYEITTRLSERIPRIFV